ncbi:MAG: putative 3-deoxy-D-manno-octulosonate 8-phosphate phosphatase [Pseudomonadota bacterium]|jgi:lipopolysaccharide export system protein LptC
MTSERLPGAVMRGAGRSLRGFWERVILYLPVVLMGLLALLTYWMIQRSPGWVEPSEPRKPVGHEVDFYMRGAQVKTYDHQGRLQSEIVGREIRHYGDDLSLEVDEPRLYLLGRDDRVMRASAEQGWAKEDGSRFELRGQAVMTRSAIRRPDGSTAPEMRVQSDLLIVDAQQETLQSPKPVVFFSGQNRFSADSLSFDNRNGVTELKGRVRVTLVPADRRQP